MTVSRSPTREELRCTICHAPGPVPIDHIREKGMGGSAERDVPENKIPLCPTCHDLKSLKRIKTWAKQLNMDTWVYHWQRVGSDVVIRVPVRIDERHGCLVPAGEEVMPDAARDRLSLCSVVNAAAPRPSPSPSSLEDWLTQDWSVLSDDELQAKYDAAEKMQGFAYLLRCKAIHAYRENHVQTWGESWTEQAIERFGISRRTCQAQANIWEICVRRDAYTEIAPLTDSRSLMQAIGRQSVEKGVETMEAAIAYFAEYAEPPTVKALVQEEQPERERHACPLCNFSHWVVVESEWKT